MRALSILQPWAWLIVNGVKDIENRVWTTKYRGEFLVHAGKGFDDDAFEDLVLDPEFAKGMPTNKADFERGGVVGSAVLVDCVDDHDSDWFNGPYGFVLRDQKVLPFRPARGMLNFFEIPDQEPGGLDNVG